LNTTNKPIKPATPPRELNLFNNFFYYFFNPNIKQQIFFLKGGHAHWAKKISPTCALILKKN
jgi:hypothetical protein